MVLRNRKRHSSAAAAAQTAVPKSTTMMISTTSSSAADLVSCCADEGFVVDKDSSLKHNSEDSVSSLTDTQHTSNRSRKPLAAVDQQQHRIATSSSVSLLPQFTVAKWMILRGMGMIYCVVFLASIFQNRALFGTHGLQPASMEPLLHRAFPNKDPWHGFQQFPTLFWWIPFHDDTLHMIELLGLLISLVVVLAGINSWFLMATLWILYFSIVTMASIGTSFYAYGWESQILETGFLCIFLCALPSWRYGWAWMEKPNGDVPPNGNTRPTAINLWVFQWLIFRITTGAGLIKIRGSSCWTEKTCLYYHFETQPIPSPFSFVITFYQNSFIDEWSTRISLYNYTRRGWFYFLVAQEYGSHPEWNGGFECSCEREVDCKQDS